jgi:hypothetical protein
VAAQSDLDAKLAGFVRSYIRCSSSSVSAEKEEHWMYRGLEWLLGELLKGSDGWGGWIDGILPAADMLPDSIQVISAVEVSVRGRAIWGKGSRDGFSIEPFFGSVRISETQDEIVSYEIKFGDAACGLGRTPYGKHIRRPDWFFPTEWLYTFSKGAIDAIQPAE